MGTRTRKASIGVSAHLGWAATAIIAVERGGLRVLASDRIETSRPGDREALEPHHVAGGFQGLTRVPPPPNPQAVLKRGLAKQRRHTAKVLAGVEKQLGAQGYTLAYAGLPVSRGRAAPSFEKAVGSHTQIHIEEGLAVRDSIRRALREAGVRVRDFDQKTLVASASEVLGESESALLAALAAAGPENGGPWRKEEKLAALAAWAAWPRRAV